MIAIDVKSYCKLFVEDMFSPSLIFKVFCMKLWPLSDYVLLCRLIVKCLNLVGESNIKIIQCRVMSCRKSGLQKMWLNTMFNPSLYI